MATLAIFQFPIEFGTVIRGLARTILDIDASKTTPRSKRYRFGSTRGAFQSYSAPARADFKSWMFNKYGSLNGLMRMERLRSVVRRLIGAKLTLSAGIGLFGKVQGIIE